MKKWFFITLLSFIPMTTLGYLMPHAECTEFVYIPLCATKGSPEAEAAQKYPETLNEITNKCLFNYDNPLELCDCEEYNFHTGVYNICELTKKTYMEGETYRLALLEQKQKELEEKQKELEEKQRLQEEINTEDESKTGTNISPETEIQAESNISKDTEDKIIIEEKTEEDTQSHEAPELNQAVSWMYEKGLTVFNEPESFMASRGLRRDEAAKFYVQYAKQVMGKTPDYSKQGCNFKDLNEAWSDLKDIIVESCQLGLFQGNNGKFMPTQQLTNAQAITVFMRLREGYKDEKGSHFANNYYESAHSQGLLYDTPLDNRENFDKYTTRWDVAKMLFRGQKQY